MEDLPQEEERAGGWAGGREMPSQQQPAAPGPPARNNTMQRLAAVVVPELPMLALSGVFLIGYSTCNMAIPHLLGRLVDVAAQHRERKVASTSWHLSGIFVAGGLLNFARLAVVGHCGERITSYLRCAAFASLLEQPCAYFDEERHGTAELCQRLQGDCERVGRALSDGAANGAKSFVQLAGALTMMLRTSARLAALIAALVPAAGLSAWFFGRRVVRSTERKRTDELGAANTAADEVLSSIRVIAAFCREDDALQRYRSHADHVRDAGVQLGYAAAQQAACLQTTSYYVVLALLGYGGNLVSRGQLSVGALTSMLIYSGYSMLGIMGLARMVFELHQVAGMSQPLLELVYHDSPFTARGPIYEAHGLPDDAVAGSLRVEDVSFSYPSRPWAVVWGGPERPGVSFTVRGGRCCALVGPSGAGKSSFCGLLLRMYEPLGGRILLDNVDTRAIPTEHLRQLVAYVPQEPQLFATTIAENILFGLPPHFAPSAEEQRPLMLEAAKLASVDEFACDPACCPNGYDTYVGERGRGLSGGQKQRVAIARALIRVLAGVAKVLVLDEAASSLDAASRRQLIRTTRSLLHNAEISGRHTTVLLITHDDELMRCCDHIVVIKDGTVAAAGSYDQTREQVLALRAPKTSEHGDEVVVGSPAIR